MPPTDPCRLGYVFAGWTCEGEPWDFASAPVTADLTLTATWGEIVYTENLNFAKQKDGTYKVSVGKAINDEWIHVPPTHNGVAVTAIAERGFANAKHLKRVIIPTSVTSIGRSAFWGCDAIEYLSLPFVGIERNQTLGILFDDQKTIPTSLRTVEITGNLPMGKNGVLRGVTEITSVAILSGTYIEKKSFQTCIRLKDVVLPDELERIEQYAFNNCLLLTTVTLPATVTYIGEGAFSVCPSLRMIRFEGTVEQWEAIEKHETWLNSTDYCLVYCADGIVDETKQ